MGSSMKAERYLLNLKAGERLGQNDRYTILFPTETGAVFPHPTKYSAYVVQDTKDSTCKTLRISGKTEQTEPSDVSSKILELLDENARKFVLLASDTFTHQGHVCFIYELCGPNARTRIEDYLDDYPASWCRKVFHDTLRALEAIHKNGVIHASLSDYFLVITYPNLDASNVEQVRAFYHSGDPSKAEQTSVKFNDWGCATSQADYNLDFQVKLQCLRFATTRGSQDYQRHWTWCPTPEGFFENQVSDKADIWDAAVMMTNIISGASFYSTLIGGRWSNEERRLFTAQRFLGQLPEKYREQIFAGSKSWKVSDDNSYETNFEPSLEGPKTESLLETMVQMRLDEDLQNSSKLAADMTEEQKIDVFSRESLALAADLLLKMLRYDPGERISATQALQHPFFHQDLKYASVS